MLDEQRKYILTILWFLCAVGVAFGQSKEVKGGVVPNHTVSIGGAVGIPAGEFRGYSLSFQPRLRMLYSFPGSGVQIGVGVELGYEIRISKIFRSDRYDYFPVVSRNRRERWSIFNAMSLFQIRVPLSDGRKAYWWIAPGLGISHIREVYDGAVVFVGGGEEPFGGSDSVVRVLVAGRTGVAIHVGRRGNISIQPEIGVAYNRWYRKDLWRVQPGISVGFHF